MDFSFKVDLYVVVFPAWISNCESILSQECFFFSFPFFFISCLNCMLPVELLCKVMGKITVSSHSPGLSFATTVIEHVSYMLYHSLPSIFCKPQHTHIFHNLVRIRDDI